MVAEDDEVIKFYQAQRDWRAQGSTGDAPEGERFKMLMGHYKYAMRTSPTFSDWEPQYPASVVKIGTILTALYDEAPRYVTAIKFKIPNAPQKNLYPHQVILFLPYDPITSYVDDTPPDDQFKAMIMCGDMSGYKYGNGDEYAQYDKDLEGASQTGYKAAFSEIGFFQKIDGSSFSDFKVDAVTEFNDEVYYPLGGSGASKIMEMSNLEYGRCNGIVPTDKWWALNFSPMCWSEGWEGGEEKEYVLWSRHQDEAVTHLEWGRIVCNALYLEIYNQKSGVLGSVPNPWDSTDDFDDTVWGEIFIDGAQTDVKLRPILGVIWKKNEGENVEVKPANDLKIESSELQGLAKFTWTPSDDEEFTQYRVGLNTKPGLPPSTEFISDDKNAEETNFWIPMGYYEGDPYVTPAWASVETGIGAYLPLKYYSNFVGAYRPSVIPSYPLGPVLHTKISEFADQSPILSGGKLTGPELLKIVWAVGAGIDTWWAGDKAEIFVEYSVQDVTITTPPVTPLLGEMWYIPVGSTGAWAAQIGDVAECTNPVGPVWAYLPLNEGEAVFNSNDGLTYAETSTPGVVATTGFKYIKIYESGNITLLAGMDIVLLLNDKSERAHLTLYSSLKDRWQLEDPLDQPFIANTLLFAVRRKISKVHFLFDDGGRGSTDEVFEMDFGYLDDGTGNFPFITSDTSFLKRGDRIVIMDGFNAVKKIVDYVSGNQVFLLGTTNYWFSARTQCYKIPEYMYSIAGDISFAMAFEAEGGFTSDWIANEYVHTIADIPPIAIISAEKLLAEIGEVIRFIGIESACYSNDQILGLGVPRYEWRIDGGSWIPTSDPYYDVSWPAIGSKLVELRVRNAAGVYSSSPYASLNVEVADVVVSGIISDIIDVLDFSNSVHSEGIQGGRDVQADENISGDKKSFDSVTKSVRSVRLTGLASTVHATHPIAKVDVWKQAQITGPPANPEFAYLPDDLITLLYLENHTAALKMLMEGKDTYLLMGPFSRDREWKDVDNRHWGVTFTIVE